MTQAAAKTGVGPTVMVAVEQYFPSRQRLIIDDLAYSVLPFSARAFVWAMRPPLARNWMVRATERAFPGLWSGIMCRKNVISMNRSSPYPERSVPSSISALVSIPAPTDYRPWPKSRCGKLINLRTSIPNRTVSGNGLAGRLSISLSCPSTSTRKHLGPPWLHGATLRPGRHSSSGRRRLNTRPKRALKPRSTSLPRPRAAAASDSVTS